MGYSYPVFLFRNEYFLPEGINDGAIAHHLFTRLFYRLNFKNQFDSFSKVGKLSNGKGLKLIEHFFYIKTYFKEMSYLSIKMTTPRKKMTT